MADRHDSDGPGRVGLLDRLGELAAGLLPLDDGVGRSGWVVSGVGHLALLLFLVFAGALSKAPLPPLEFAEVTVISEEEFALLTRPDTAPEVGAGVAAPDPAEAPPPPEIVETPPEPRESVPPPEPPAPEASTPPAPSAPPVAEAPPQEDPAPEAAPRVAPEAAPEAPPDALEAPEVTERAEPDAAADPDPAVEAPTPTAPPEAAEEIVTEAEIPGGAPEAEQRPRARPDRVARIDPGRSFEASSTPDTEAPEAELDPDTPSEPETAEAPEEPPEDDPLAAAIAGAVADAISNTPDTAPEVGPAAGPPLSQGERDAFRVAVESCWIVDPGSPAATVTVVVGMRLTRDAKPDTASIELIGSQGGDDSAVRTAFETARRAILRCGASGFPLPPDKYERWAQVEMTFNPDGMRIR